MSLCCKIGFQGNGNVSQAGSSWESGEVTIAGSESHSLPQTETKQEEEVTKWINRSTNFVHFVPPVVIYSAFIIRLEV